MKRFFAIPFIYALLSGCANMAALTGGPVDKIPPVVTSSYPQHLQNNINPQKIEISFDEYIQLNDASNQVIISPRPAQSPEIVLQGKTVTIKFKETLKPNTTYTINFGNAIKDNNEGNLLQNYYLTFATGEQLDTLKISGMANHLYARKKEANWIVGLYENLSDSAPFTLKPDYLTRTADDGSFVLRNLPHKTFQVIACNDENNNLQVDDGELIGFYPQNITPDTATKINIRMFNSPKKTPVSLSQSYQKGFDTWVFGFNQDICDSAVQILPALQATQNIYNEIEYSPTGDSIYYPYIIPVKTDSAYFTLMVKENMREQVVIPVKKAQTDSLRITWNKRNREVLDLTDSILIFTNQQATLKDASRITLYQDSIPMADTIKQVSHTSWTLHQRLMPEHKYTIKIQDSAFINPFNQYNKATELTFSTSQQKLYGTLSFFIRNPDKKPLIIELIKDNKDIITTTFLNTSESITYPYIKPGTYQIRVVYDENQNFKYDPGSLDVPRKMPEKVYWHDQDIIIKANWEVLDLSITPFFSE